MRSASVRAALAGLRRRLANVPPEPPRPLTEEELRAFQAEWEAHLSELHEFAYNGGPWPLSSPPPWEQEPEGETRILLTEEDIRKSLQLDFRHAAEDRFRRKDPAGFDRWQREQWHRN